MTRILFLLGIAFFTLCLFKGNNSGVAAVQAKDRTGSPVGQAQQCNQCHNSAAQTAPTIVMTLRDAGNNAVTEYLPGDTYTFEVLLNSPTAQSYGFQSVGLITSTNANAGNFVSALANTKVTTLNGRKYPEHVSRSTSGLFKATWTAPAAGSGTVKFYSAGIASNSSNSSAGDKGTTASPLTITEISLAGMQNETKPLITVFPNPATDFINVVFPESAQSQIEIVGLDGRTYFSSTLTTFTGGKIPLSGLSNGTYILRIITESSNYNSVFIKQDL